MDRRGRSPPRRGPPPPPYGMDMRRRSRSPPGYRGRSPKRSRRDDDFYPPPGRFRDDYDYPPPRGGPPPPRDYDYPPDRERRRERSSDRDPRRENYNERPKMMSFKEFLLKQNDDPSPDEANERYKKYLVEFHGGEIKAEFEANKNKESVRNQFDPRCFEKALTKRDEEAAESRSRFFEDLSDKRLDPAAEGFNQGALDLAPQAPTNPDEPGPATAPDFCWQPHRVVGDLVLARRLARRLEWEKSFADDNTLLPPKSDDDVATQTAADAEAQKEVDAAKEEGRSYLPGAHKRFVAVEEATPDISPETYDEVVGQLDLLLTYLWRVHGIDFYSCYELTAQEFGQRLTACRLLRGPQPAELVWDKDAQGEAGQPGGSQEESGGVEACWARRIQEGDPLEARCQRAKIEEQLDKWIESQIIMHNPEKWGSHVSAKMFKARKFVVKHIRTKHEDKLKIERDRICDEVYFEAFKTFKEEEQAAKEAEAAAQHEHGGEDHAMGGEEGEAHAGPGRGGMMGRGGGRGMGRGRGGAGMGGMMPPGMMMDPMSMMAMAGMGMMPGFPMPMPMPMPLPMMMPMMMNAMRGRGRGGVRGGMPGRGGSGGGGRGHREYYDLDNPHNNRALLDYGDL